LGDNATDTPQKAALTGNGIAVFSLAATPTTVSVANDTKSTTVMVAVSAPASFTDTVALSCSGGSGATCSFNPASIMAGQTSTLTINSLTAVTANPDTLTVVGKDGMQSASATVTIYFADFSLAITPPLLTIPAGQSGSYTVTLTPLNGFNSETKFACFIPTLQQATCKFSADSVTPDGMNPSSVTVTITTTARTSAPPRSGWRILPPPVPLGFETLLLVALLLVGMWYWHSQARFRPRTWVGIAALLLWVTVWSSCGNVPPAPPGTPAGDYVVSVTATSSKLVHTISSNLVID
jgi:hypothetical protein